MHPSFKGVFPPMVTIFDQKGEIDYDANKRLADWLIDKGVHGLLLMGSTGEFPSLTTLERKQFVEELTRYINKRVPVLVGVGSTSFKETIDFAKHAEANGADGLLVVNPYYWTHTDEQLFHYFSSVAGQVNLPVILYNIPQMTGQHLSIDLISRLAASTQNIIGIKETVSDIGHIRSTLLEVKRVREDFIVFAAFDEHVLPALQIGSLGSINGTSVFAPELSVHMFEAYQQGNYEQAIEDHNKLVRLMEIYEYSSPFYLGVKEAVNQRVLGKTAGFRFPAQPNQKELEEKVRDFLQKNDLGIQTNLIG